MKQLSYLPALALASLAWTPQGVSAQQQSPDKAQQEQYQEIIIRRKGDSAAKMTIQINGDEVLVNGKKPGELKNKDVTVIQRRVTPGENRPFNFDFGPGHGPRAFSYSFGDNANKALLGVLTAEDHDEGAMIQEVEEGTAADKGGLKKGDVITRVGDQAVHTPEDLVKAIGSHQPDDKVTITYERDGKTATTDVTLGQREAAPLMGFSMPPQSRRWNRNFRNFPRAHPPFAFGWMDDDTPRLGMTVQDQQEEKGVKVMNVLPGSLAEKAGFEKGDVIKEVDGQPVEKAEDVIDALKAGKDKESLQATVQRDGKMRNLTISLAGPDQMINL